MRRNDAREKGYNMSKDGRWLGTELYFVRYACGRHELVTDYCGDDVVLFAGTYSECIETLDAWEREYLDSLF